MMIPVVGFILKVIGNRSEIPAAAPIPGIAPTTIPSKAPINAAKAFPKENATEKPCINISKSFISGSPQQLDAKYAPRKGDSKPQNKY
jgi:hypothetical protein